jgi:hypothetical protein
MERGEGRESWGESLEKRESRRRKMSQDSIESIMLTNPNDTMKKAFKMAILTGVAFGLVLSSYLPSIRNCSCVVTVLMCWY